MYSFLFSYKHTSNKNEKSYLKNSTIYFLNVYVRSLLKCIGPFISLSDIGINLEYFFLDFTQEYVFHLIRCISIFSNYLSQINSFTFRSLRRNGTMILLLLVSSPFIKVFQLFSPHFTIA